MKKSWRKTFVPMDTKNFCTALRFNPHSESHVSEEHDTSEFGGDGT